MSNTVAYPELVSEGVSKSHQFEGLVKVGAGKAVVRADLKKIMAGGASGQPENPPGYATVTFINSRIDVSIKVK